MDIRSSMIDDLKKRNEYLHIILDKVVDIIIVLRHTQLNLIYYGLGWTYIWHCIGYTKYIDVVGWVLLNFATLCETKLKSYVKTVEEVIGLIGIQNIIMPSQKHLEYAKCINT